MSKSGARAWLANRETPFGDDDWSLVERIAPLPSGWNRVEL